MTTIKWDYISENGHAEMQAEINGSLLGLTAAIARLIRHVYNQTPEVLRPMFQKAVQAVTSDDSPTWSPEQGVKIDLNALKNMGGQQRDN